MSSGQLLRRAGLRRTVARRAVLEILDQAEHPLTHHEIADRPEVRRIDRVTLYRTLATLQHAGLLHRVQGVDSVWRFCSHRPQPGKCGGNHIHFLCLDCRQMGCLPEQHLPWVEAPTGAEVFGKQLVVYGRCAPCSARHRASALP